MKSLATLSLVLLFAVAPAVAQAQTETFTVNSTLDLGDATPGDGDCLTPTDAVCTLRAAIEEANATTADEILIEFDLPQTGTTFTPATAFPVLTAANIEVDGTTQSGYADNNRLVVVDGSACITSDCVGIELNGDGQAARGLTIHSFSGAGVALGPDAAGSIVERSFIGVDPSGTTVTGNEVGIHVQGGGNILNENVVSGSTQSGIVLDGQDALNNTLQENRIGTDIAGALQLGNGSHGVLIRNGAESSNVFRNWIAYNAGAGVRVVDNGTTGNLISRNRIYRNDGIGIDLGPAGATANDDTDGQEDIDEGPNRLQNWPVITFAAYTPSNGRVEIRYRVDTRNSAASFPLDVQFFVVDADGEEGAGFIGADEYTRQDARQPQSVTFFRPDLDVTKEDFVVAVATDRNGNTSEFSMPANQLPVELVDFRHTIDEGDVVLHWKTLSEKNNDGFFVQRKVNGAYEDVSDVFVKSKSAAGNSTETLEYSVRLDGLSAGQHVLRLRQRDLDGSLNYSRDLEVVVEQSFALKAYPSPFRTEASIVLSGVSDQEVSVEVYNVLGQRVALLHEGPVSGELRTRFQAGNLPSGLYILRVEGETFSETRRLTHVK